MGHVWHYDNFTPEQRIEVQKAIDTMYKGLAAQDWKPSIFVGVGGDVKCKYRGINGRKCAVGHLIPDEQYKLELEMLLPSVDHEMQVFMIDHCGLEHANYNVFALLREYQRIHDRHSFGDTDGMQETFEKYTLDCGFVINKEN